MVGLWEKVEMDTCSIYCASVEVFLAHRFLFLQATFLLYSMYKETKEERGRKEEKEGRGGRNERVWMCGRRAADPVP